MSVDREYRIRIQTVADQGGIDDTSKAISNLGGKTDEASGKFGKLGEAGRDLHRLQETLIEQFPALGLAMRAAFSPVGAAVTGAVLLLSAFNQKMKESADAAKAAGDEAAKPWGNVKDSLREAVDQVNTAKQSYEDFKNHLHDTNNVIMQDLDLAIQKIESETAAWQKLAAIKAGGQPAPGVTPEEKIGAESTQKEIAITQDALKRAEEAEARGKERAGHAERLATDTSRVSRMKELGREETSLKSSFDQQEAKRKQLQDIADAAQRKYEELAVNPQTGQQVAFGAHVERVKAAAQSAQAEATRLQEDRDRTGRAMEAVHDSLRKLTTEQTGYETELGHAKQKLAALSGEVDALKNKLAGLQQKGAIEQAGMTMREGGQGLIVSQGAAALVALQQHQGRLGELSKQQLDALHGLNFLLDAIGANNQMMKNILVKHANDLQAISREVSVLTQRQNFMGRNYQ